MFKLLKELTRAPEPLNRPFHPETSLSGANSPPYAARRRNRSPVNGVPTVKLSHETASAEGSASVGINTKPAKEEVESDEDALKVVELLKVLEEAGSGENVMALVEVSYSA